MIKLFKRLLQLLYKPNKSIIPNQIEPSKNEEVKLYTSDGPNYVCSPVVKDIIKPKQIDQSINIEEAPKTPYINEGQTKNNNNQVYKRDVIPDSSNVKFVHLIDREFEEQLSDGNHDTSHEIEFMNKEQNPNRVGSQKIMQSKVHPLKKSIEIKSFEVGDVLYHKNNKIKCIIVQVLEKDIRLRLEKAISNKTELVLPKTHVGEWLFYHKNDVDLSIKELLHKEEYSDTKRIKEYKIQNKQKTEHIFAIKEIIKSRHIKYLIHFTRIENLESILINGFIPRIILETYNMDHLNNDNHRIDGKKDSTCFSIEYPNNFLFNKFRTEQVDSKWVIIKINSSLLYSHDDRIYYCYENAARSDMRKSLALDQLRGVKDFENMFREEVDYIRNSVMGTKYRYLIKNIRDYLPTSEQAEILIAGDIPTKFIKSVYFNNMYDKRSFIDSVLDKDLLIKYKLDVADVYFQKNRDELTFVERSNKNGSKNVLHSNA